MKKQVLNFMGSNSVIPTIMSGKEYGFPNKIRDIVKGYHGDSDNGEAVTTMDGKLNLRPAYQRDYIHAKGDNWSVDLLDSIFSNAPINLIYIAEVTDPNTGEVSFEVVDGQQRLITICSFVEEGMPVTTQDANTKTFKAISVKYPELANKFLDYELDIQIIKGTTEQKLRWFEKINKPATILTPQELRNAANFGYFVEEAKKLFTRNKSFATEGEYDYKKYTLDLNQNRQEVLETAIDWLSFSKYRDEDMTREERIERYMSENRDRGAEELKSHWKQVCDWANKFRVTEEDKTFLQVNWGYLYARFGNKPVTKEIIDRIAEIRADEEVTVPKHAYEYVLDGENVRLECKMLKRRFTEHEKKMMLEFQGGVDPITGQKLTLNNSIGHHIDFWADGGKTEIGNLIVVSDETHENKLHSPLTKLAHRKEMRMFPNEVREERDKAIRKAGKWEKYQLCVSARS